MHNSCSPAGAWQMPQSALLWDVPLCPPLCQLLFARLLLQQHPSQRNGRKCSRQLEAPVFSGMPAYSEKQHCFQHTILLVLWYRRHVSSVSKTNNDPSTALPVNLLATHSFFSHAGPLIPDLHFLVSLSPEHAAAYVHWSFVGIMHMGQAP